MRTAVMISIRPEQCEKILNGEKTVEIRKSRPKLQTPFKVYIYCTKNQQRFFHGGIGETLDDLYRMPDGQIKYGYSGEIMCQDKPWGKDNFLNGKVIAEFICKKAPQFRPEDIVYGCEYSRRSCLTIRDLLNYGKGRKHGLYAWYISNLKIYDKPKEPSRFQTLDAQKNKSCQYRKRVYQNQDFNNGGYLYGSYYCEEKNDFCCKCHKKYIKRPPQSWRYIEEMEELG